MYISVSLVCIDFENRTRICLNKELKNVSQLNKQNMKLMKKLNIKIQDDAEKIVSEENKNFENAGYESKCKELINCF